MLALFCGYEQTKRDFSEKLLRKIKTYFNIAKNPECIL